MEIPRHNNYDPLLKDLYRESEYLRRHLPLSGRYFRQFLEILEPSMPDDYLTFLQRGAELHDIGKRAARGFLEKPEFTQQEREIMHWHPQVGESFLTGLYGKNHPYVVIAGGHHERFDGEGYPRGLKGEAIPYYARVMAIADIFSTVTQKRPYSDHIFTHHEVLQLLENEAGKIFDPHMVGQIVERLKYETA